MADLRIHEEANEVARVEWFKQFASRRPELSSDRKFQLFAAVVHAVCLVFNISACLYHLRRAKNPHVITTLREP